MGQSLDVIEIDGASNRGIDDIRQINETVGFAPSHGKYKIYIIDEVHMLTKEAFNALLKTLEEPPEQAKFFFATTEPHKVPATILSRCQRFDLGRLLHGQITAKLAAIACDLGRSVAPEALHRLAQFADGSLRDAESLLDQLLCFSDGAITLADVHNALGLAPQELLFSFDEAYEQGNLAYAFTLSAELFAAGKDLTHFLEQLLDHFRSISLCKTVGPQALDFPEELATRYATTAQRYHPSHALSALDLLLKAEGPLAKSGAPRVVLEMTLLNILRLKHKIPIEVLVRRLTEIEEKLFSSPRESEPVVQTQPVALQPSTPLPASEPAAEPPVLKPVPFNPYTVPAETPPPPTPVEAPRQGKHPSHYETVLRFTAVELEGTVVKK